MNINQFVDFARALKGDEKSEAQLFCDRLFQAFGHEGIIEAEGTLEARIKFGSGRTKFADCIWSPPGADGVLIEMKKRSVPNLESHFPQVRDYWIEMNPEVVIGPGAQKPTYIILCNFDRFLIYRHLTFVDEVALEQMPERLSALNFLLPEQKEPIFKHNVEAISKEVAGTIGELFKYLVIDLKENRDVAQRYILQSVLALFSEDFQLLPDAFFSELIRDCQQGQSAYDLIGGLFHQMASPRPARAGRFKDVAYFNGGLFDQVDPIELDARSLGLLSEAAAYNWKYVNPSIFGALFESTMNAAERHTFGAHFTSEADIRKIINPTIVRPWREKIDKATTLRELTEIREQLSKFRVLDPACGCGNFLYVAYLSLKDLEMYVIEKIAANFAERSIKGLRLGHSQITTRQLLGIDIQPIAVEVAKMTMMIAKEQASKAWNQRIQPLMGTLGLDFDEGLPLDRLDDTIVVGDALLDDWPESDVVVGNPPFQSKNKASQEMDRAYLETVRAKYPDVPGRADYCVYWLKKAHDHLKPDQRAGLVGTNTIRQNYSRQGGLDYILANKGTITDAVGTQVWSGDAVVYVSIVNWIKGPSTAKKHTLSVQVGDSLNSPFEFFELERISSALSHRFDVTQTADLKVNSSSQACLQGQTHGHPAFLVPQKVTKNAEARELLGHQKLLAHPEYAEVLFPYLTGKDELLGHVRSIPTRYVIDFRKKDIFQAQSYPELFEIIQPVYEARKKKAEEQIRENEETLKANPLAHVNHHHENFFKSWWKMSYSRDELMDLLDTLPRYIVCVRTTKRPIFEFVHAAIHPNDALQVFPMADNYSFGVLQSNIHWEWFCAKCSTLKRDWRYTSNTVFDSFPWPQSPDAKSVAAVADAAIELWKLRRKTMAEHGWNLRQLYRAVEQTPNNPVSEAQEKLDLAVRKAYGMKAKVDPLEFLFDLNQKCAERESVGETIQSPGLPVCIADSTPFISEHCIKL